ncbi:uncharacterized protein LOC141837829 [Curcuma longa]|uniref:uncharacterized protein LOC141837829 n=1 Tax=Curcuma longa TaxID=136217 RepID=UPI003D9EE803
MAYVENGVVKSKRTIWRLSIISDFFWAIINFIKIFFGTLFSDEKSDEYKKSGKKWDGGPGGGSGGGPYGGGGGGPRPRTMSDLRADHNALPACGSCCGGG